MSYFYKLYAPLQANCPQLADNFIEGLYIADIQRVVAQSKNRPQTADDFKLLFLIPWDHHRRIIDKCKGNFPKDFKSSMPTIEELEKGLKGNPK